MKWIKGKTRLRSYTRTASTVFAEGALVYWVSGLVAPADATSGDHIGIAAEAVAAADADYATAGVKILVETPLDKQCEFEAPVDGTLATTSVGETMDLTDSENVNQAATSKNVVTCTKFINSALGHFVLNASFDTKNVEIT